MAKTATVGSPNAVYRPFAGRLFRDGGAELSPWRDKLSKNFVITKDGQDTGVDDRFPTIKMTGRGSALGDVGPTWYISLADAQSKLSGAPGNGYDKVAGEAAHVGKLKMRADELLIEGKLEQAPGTGEGKGETYIRIFEGQFMMLKIHPTEPAKNKRQGFTKGLDDAGNWAAYAKMSALDKALFAKGAVLIYHYWIDTSKGGKKKAAEAKEARKQAFVAQAEATAAEKGVELTEEQMEKNAELAEGIAKMEEAEGGKTQPMATADATEVAETPEAAYQMHALHQQGFLMRGLGLKGLIPGLEEHKQRGAGKGRQKEYKAITAIETGGAITNPMQIKNLLTAKNYAHHFLSLTNTQISALVPRIRLFRVNYTSDFKTMTTS